MNLDSDSGGAAERDVTGFRDGRVSGTARRRVNLRRVLTGLRHLHGSTEPARVFTELAAVCVPALCDQMMIDIDENRTDETGIDRAGAHRYRTRQPGGLPWPETEDPSPSLDPGQVAATGQQVSAVVGSPPAGGPQYTARLLCRWNPGYAPTETETDAALVGVLADHSAALVHRERTTGHITDPATAHQVGATLGRTHQTFVQVADTVLHTGGLPDQRTAGPREHRSRQQRTRAT